MEDTNNNETNTRKRARVDSDESDSGSNPDTREAKRVELDSVGESTESRVNSVSSESGEIKNEILDILDDTDTVPEIQDLDSVIKSFEEEILQLTPAPAPATCSDESQPDLGYLLEASDDELGLPPPATSPTTEFPPSYDSFELENGVPSYDPFGFGFGEHYEVMNEFLTVGGLFEYPEASDFSEFLWRPETETLPAV